jgi:hypothetical protein
VVRVNKEKHHLRHAKADRQDVLRLIIALQLRRAIEQEKEKATEIMNK